MTTDPIGIGAAILLILLIVLHTTDRKRDREPVYIVHTERCPSGCRLTTMFLLGALTTLVLLTWLAS